MHHIGVKISVLGDGRSAVFQVHCYKGRLLACAVKWYWPSFKPQASEAAVPCEVQSHLAGKRLEVAKPWECVKPVDV